MLFPIGRRPLFINGLPAFDLNTIDPITSSESAGTFSLGLRASYVPMDALRVYGTCAAVRANANAYLESVAVYVIGRGVFYWSATAGTDTTGEDTSYITNGTGGFVFSTTAYLDFTDALGTPPYRAGRTFYRDNSLNVMTDFPGVSIQLGEESQIQVYNDDATATNNAQVVYAFGPQGQRLAVRKLANGVGDNASRMVGLMTHNVPSHNNGRATTFGLVRDYDTHDFTGGAKVYSSDVAGDLTETIPPGDKDGVRVGFVMNSHPVDGAIFVCPQYIPRLASTTANLPTTPRLGEVYLDVTLNCLVTWNGTSWQRALRPGYADLIGTLATAAAAGGLLSEAYGDTPELWYWFTRNLDKSMSLAWQMPHGWAKNAVEPHIHIVGAGDTTGDLRITGRYAWSSYGGGLALPPLWANWTTFSITKTIQGTDQWLPNVVSLGEIEPPAAAKYPSAFLHVYLTRPGLSDVLDTYEGSKPSGTAAANIGIEGVDCHVQVVDLGTAGLYA